MGTLYSVYLRELVAAAVESGGMSGHGAVGHIGVGGSTAIGWIRHLRKTGGVGPCQMGRHTLTSISSEHLTWLLERTKKNFTLRGLVGNLTERGRKVDDLTVCGFAGTEKLNFRKAVVTGERGRLDVAVTRKITASRQNLIEALHSSLVGIGRFRAAVIYLSAWPATAYRPFDGTDAAMAGVNEIEVELQPIGRLQTRSQPTLITPAIGCLYAIALGLTFEMGWGS